MKLSLHTVRYYNELYKCSDNSILKDTDALAAKIGAQLGAIDEIVHTGQKYDGIVVARIVTCEKHPNADKLSLCTVDDGGAVKDVERDGNGHVQVVCGAPNARAGLIVAWIPPGATVPASIGKDPFVLEAREIRGKVSNGMLASPSELSISDNHDGILEIDPQDVGEELAKPGTPFKNLYGLDDVIFDIENKMFTHRPDLFGQLGLGRELAGIHQLAFKSPDWYMYPEPPKSQEDLPLGSVVVDDAIKDLVPRYCLMLVKGISVQPSPYWMQAFLTRVGIRPINNVVDITNYVMHLTGQPLHAFDYDKVAALNGGTPSISVRKPFADETVKLLNGKTITPHPDTILIAGQASGQTFGIGGVMGGSDTEVDAGTKNIIIESAVFDMYSIRRTSMEHGLFTEATTRFSKGQSPHQCDKVLIKAVNSIIKHAGGTAASPLIDLRNKVEPNPTVSVTAGFINQRLGLDLRLDDITKLLTNVDFWVEPKGDVLEIVAPFWRTDIEIPEDIVEEIGRLYGFDHLPLELPVRDLSPVPRNAVLDLRNGVSRSLAAAGANEVLTYSFVHGNVLDKAGQDKSLAFQLSNALSPDLQYYRLSLTPGLLDKVHPNLKSDMVRSDDNEIAYFEINKVHLKSAVDDEGLPAEDMRLGLVFAADDKTAKRKYEGAAYYAALNYFELLVPGASTQLVPLIGYDFGSDEWGSQTAKPYSPARSGVFVRDGVVQAIVGEFQPGVSKSFKLPAFSAGLEMKLQITGTNRQRYVAIPKFPKVQQDITLRVPAGKPFAEVYTLLINQLQKYQPEQTYYVLEPSDVFQKEDEPDSKRYTFRLWISSHERTLTAEDVNSLLDRLAAHAKETLNADRI